MKNIKKIFLIIISCALLICTILLFAGCGSNEDKPQDNEPQKYDVAIRVGYYEVDANGHAIDRVGIYNFPIGTDEITVERNYSKREYRCYIYQYNLPEHPRWGREWFEPNGSGTNVFSISLSYRDLDDKQQTVETVKEPGKYTYIIEANSGSNLWNYRSCLLHINVLPN